MASGDIPEIKGIQSMRGSIQGIVRSKGSAADAIRMVQSYYQMSGRRFTGATAAATAKLYSGFVEMESKSYQFMHVRGDVPLSARYINYASLDRTMNDFTANPMYNVRVHVTGNAAGITAEKWATIVYDVTNPIPNTTGDLRSSIIQWAASNGYPDLPAGAELHVSEIAINAM